MNRVAELTPYATAAGACMPAGALLARVGLVCPSWLEREFRYFIIAFGGGAMLGAVALVLVPAGMEQVHAPVAVLACVLAGGLFFFAIERALGLHRRESPQRMGMLLDHLPESLALGGAFAFGAPMAPLLAAFIGLPNLPEGFNAYRELTHLPGARPRRVLWIMCLLVALGPLLAGMGWFFLAAHPQVLGAIMLFASGGILYLILQDIAPQSRLQKHWFPPLGAVAGFALSLLGKLLLGDT